jgi:protein subunit release factor B
VSKEFMPQHNNRTIKFPVTELKSKSLYNRMSSNSIFEEDIQETFVHSGGPGGQKVNKSATAVCIKHITSGVLVKCQKTRSQGLNRYYARKQLCEIIERQSGETTNIYSEKAAKKRKQKKRRKRRLAKKLEK